MAVYEGYYKAILDNDRYQSESDYYTLSGEITEISEGNYRYYIFLDDARIAMYDVVMLAVEGDIEFEDAESMMPSIGIFETTDYSLIPNQSRTPAGYVKGLMISGQTQNNPVSLKLLVEWRDRTRKNTYREYFSLQLDSNGISANIPVSEVSVNE